jgi:hypothetical protein
MMDGNLVSNVTEDQSRDQIQEISEEIWLLGRPTLRHYLDFVEDRMVGGASADRRVLIDEWRAANDYYYELEESEAGIADQVECRDLDAALLPLAEEVLADPRFRRSFDTLPTSISMVELDRLMVYQHHVDGQFVDILQSRLVPTPDPKALFRFSLPLSRQEAPVRTQRVGSSRYVFWSESRDFRFLRPILLRPDQICNHDMSRSIGGVVGLVVGYGSNFLNVIRADNRLLLNNGYHRACALRASGITHVPCIIETVTRRDELDLVAPSDVSKAPSLYFKAPRPPLLKDFFDPKIRKSLPVYKSKSMVEVKFEVRDFDWTE